MKKIILVSLVLLVASTALPAASPPVRIKDISHILEARDNQLMGFGLVIGLRNSGDKSQTGFTQQALSNLLSRMGVIPQSVDFRSRNVAAVMVSATLPPFVRSGQKLDVTVSSVGDATSLQGGTLLVTPLQGVDNQVYAVAQGSLLVGVEPTAPTNVPYVRSQQLTAGRIPDGALVEKEVPVALEGKTSLTIVLNDPDFTTADRVIGAIRRAGYDATARDAATVVVGLSGEEIVPLISRLENLTVTPDTIAKVVVNERTGTIVIGENVVLSPVAVSFGDLEVVIGDVALYSDGSGGDDTSSDNRFRATTSAKLNKKEGKFTVVPASPTLAVLSRALNAVGASPRDVVAILQAMKKAGAIKAEMEVI
ncbi:MAG TPA: flagellar basal body P-ring protein FlgI [Candidatus Sulfotelmatobacter sp.]|nr:flagellar basal body P-ring protein FlgI [Candidatus Sulfotelmatobacter sp.]